MSNFLLNDKDFESIHATIDSDASMELRKVSNGRYAVFEHHGGSVYENGVYTKQELRILWNMLTK